MRRRMNDLTDDATEQNANAAKDDDAPELRATTIGLAKPREAIAEYGAGGSAYRTAGFPPTSTIQPALNAGNRTRANWHPADLDSCGVEEQHTALRHDAGLRIGPYKPVAVRCGF